MRTGLLWVPVALTALTAGCETTDTSRTAAAGATGAVVGAVVADDDDRLTGAALGAAAGVALATLIGPATTQGDCIYQDSRGNRYIAPC